MNVRYLACDCVVCVCVCVWSDLYVQLRGVCVVWCVGVHAHIY